MDCIRKAPYPLLIDGRERASSEGTLLDVINPADGKLLAQVHEASDADVDAAVMAAHSAYHTVWRHTTPRARGKLLKRLGVLLEREIERLAWIETRNGGKPIAHSRQSLAAMPESFEYFGGIAAALRGETIPVNEQTTFNFTLREPLGVCALVIPWNYPLTLTINKLAPALAAGNTVVIKPSELTPLSTIEFAALFAEAGFPDGVVNVINGRGQTTGQRLVTHTLVSRVSFTGGTATGAAIGAAAMAEMKHVTLELGGKSPLIVFDDADLDAAVRVACSDIVKNSGQVCIACTRLLVQESVRERFVEKLEQAYRAIRIGLPEQPDTQMGPLVSRAQYERVHAYLAIAAEEGARPVAYADLASRPELAQGYYVAPTLLHGARPEMRTSQEEIFGPVQSLITFGNEAEAIRIANDSIYGLAAVIFARDGGKALRVARALEAGNIAINTGVKATIDAPFGGYKKSGVGRERGLEAIYENTQVKNIKYDIGL